MLNDGNKLEEDGRTRQEIPQTACQKAGACNCCFRYEEANSSRWSFPLMLTSIEKTLKDKEKTYELLR